jgi:hypothetical protein
LANLTRNQGRRLFCNPRIVSENTMHDDKLAAPDRTAVPVALWRVMHAQVDPPPHGLEDELGLRLAPAREAGFSQAAESFPVASC